MARRTVTVSGANTYIDDLSTTPVALNTFTANDATPSVALGRFFITANTVATTITDFDGTLGNGHHITIYINDAYTTIAHDALKIDMPGDIDQFFGVGDIVEAISISGVWKLWNARQD